MFCRSHIGGAIRTAELDGDELVIVGPFFEEQELVWVGLVPMDPEALAGLLAGRQRQMLTQGVFEFLRATFPDLECDDDCYGLHCSTS
jgi:hypothetical protein